MGKSCFFIGHHDAPSELYPLLASAVEQHVREAGVTDFYVGHYGCFDQMAAAAVVEVKKRYPTVQLTLVLPYHPALRPVQKPEGFDSTYYPWSGENIPKRFAIVKTNRRMVDTCSHLITYAFHHLGGTGQVVDYARKREQKNLIRVTNLAQRTGAL